MIPIMSMIKNISFMTYKFQILCCNETMQFANMDGGP